MKSIGVLLLLASAVVLLGGSALAQNDPVAGGDYSFYFVTYYSNANNPKAPDATLRIVNDGDLSTSEVEGVPNGGMYAGIAVFDDSQELQECCNCWISADGVLSESVNKNLLTNSLTGKVNTRGVIKVVGNTNADVTNTRVVPGLHGWMTHVQAFNPIAGTGPYTTTETPLADANLTGVEAEALGQLCSFAFTLGSGHGICSCTPEDHDF